MTTIIEKGKTVGDYLLTPEGSQYQLIESELIMAAAPKRSHQQLLIQLTTQIEFYNKEHKLGETGLSPEDVFLDDENVFQPDLFFVLNENINKFDDAGLHGAPDMVIEILSPASSYYDTK